MEASLALAPQLTWRPQCPLVSAERWDCRSILTAVTSGVCQSSCFFGLEGYPALKRTLAGLDVVFQLRVRELIAGAMVTGGLSRKIG